MTDRTDNRDRLLDRLTTQIRRQSLDGATESSAVDRVWSRITAADVGPARPLHGCEDFRALIPELLAGTLSEARSLLVEDHTRECVACRRALLEARGHLQAPVPWRSAVVGWRVRPAFRIAALVLVALGLAALGTRIVGDRIADRNVSATLEAVDGSVLMVGPGASSRLAAGALIRSRQSIRTAKESGAVLALADGSIVEMDQRSELTLSGSMSGTSVHLARGNIIVHAAPQRNRELYVTTDDCRVAVRGTIFAVEHGLKGSRVGVIQGEVEVRQGGTRHILAPGEQVTTSDRLRAVTLSRQIAWSRDADDHLALLRELTQLHRELTSAMEPQTTRTSTALLDLAPPDTLVYVALPNLAQGLGEARTILGQRLATSEALRAWWQESVVASGLEREIETILDRLQALGEAVGDEVVVTVPRTAIGGQGSPLVMARLNDSVAFRSRLAEEVAAVNKAAARTVLAVVDDPPQAPPEAAEMMLWVRGDLCAAATDPSLLEGLALRVDRTSTDVFPGSELHTRIAEAYRDGVSWLVGIDFGAVLEHASAKGTARENEIMARLGLLDATTAVLERHRDGDSNVINADLRFAGPRRGVAAWLAEPAAMASLEFLSPEATLATAVVAKDAADMFDELLAAVSEVDADAIGELAQLEAELGFDLRADLVATLGGEAAVAVDGPLLPTPTWKVVVEVYDPATLQGTIERALAELDRKLEEHGRAGLSLDTVDVRGLPCHQVRHPDSGAGVAYLMVDGFMVLAPTPAVIERALQYRSSGVNLATSAAFRALLPEGDYTDCSALLYRNLGELSGALPGTALEQLPPEALQSLAEPGLLCVTGEAERITVAGVGGSLFGSVPALGLSSLLGQTAPPAGGSAPVSSGG